MSAPPPDSGIAAATGLSVCGKSGLRYYWYRPADLDRTSPVVVSVHGISLNAAEHLVRMRAVAERAGALLIAPWFDRGGWSGYQRLLCNDGRTRADLALLAMLDHAASQFGVDTGRIYLSGFSGGGQFAHRFAALHGDRVAACASTASGWYTYPDQTAAWPQGWAAASLPPGMALHPQARQVPLHVLVGSRDDRPEASLNAHPAIVAQQGEGRLTRARRWVAAMQQDRARHAGAPVSLTVIDRLGHDFGQAVACHALDSLIFARFGLIQTPIQSKETCLV